MKRATAVILTAATAVGALIGCATHTQVAANRSDEDCGCSGVGKLPATVEHADAATLYATGRAAAATGERQLAIARLSQAAQEARDGGKAGLSADATLALAETMTTENLCREALEPLRQALAQPGISPLQRQQLQLVLADCQLRAGRPNQATETLKGTFDLIPTAKFLVPMIRSRAMLARNESEEAYAELATIHDAAVADPLIRPEFLLLTAAEEGELHKIPEARATLASLAKALSDDPASTPMHAVGALRLLAGLGDVADSDLAPRLQALAFERLRGHDDPRIRSMILGYAGTVAESQGRLDAARDLTRQAMQPAGTAAEPGLAMLWNWQLGRLLERIGQLPAARERFAAAFSLISDRRFEDSLPPGVPAFCTHERPQDLLRDYAAFLLAHGESLYPQAQEAWKTALDVMDSRRELRIRDFLQDQCLASLVGHGKSVAAISPHSAILHVLVLPNRTETLLQVGGHLYRHVIALPEAEFLGQVQTFHEALVKAGSNEYRASGRKLYDALIQPFDDQLTSAAVDTLVVATDGPLQLIPFGALYDGKDFLIQRMAVASTPSLHLLESRPTPSQNATILAAGLRVSVHLNDEDFAPLDGTEQELTAIRALPQHSTEMVDANFTPRNFSQALADTSYSVVHVVSHAHVGPDPEDFFIVTNQGKIGIDGLDEAIRPTLYRQKPLELLVLSACETAVGDDRTALGLAGVAMKAGARSTLASLWFANDQASSAVMTAFYSRWLGKGSPSKAAALREAQLSLLRDARYNHPRYWATYILIGNWQ